MSNKIGKVILKLLHIPSTLFIKIAPTYNRVKFQLNGIKFGHKMTILGHVSVVGPGKITIGDNFMMTSGCNINPISNNLQGAFFTDSPRSEIIIGDNVGMSSTRMWVHNRITIGNNVKIGAGVLLIDTDSHPINYQIRRTSNDGTKSAPINIEDDVWIGAQSIILKGVTIGARSIIGAGSVITKDIPADCIAAGNPCQTIRKLS